MSDLENKLRALMRSDRAVLKRRQDAQDLKDAEVNDRKYSEHERKLRRDRDARRLAKIASDPIAYQQYQERYRALRKARQEMDQL
jgi:hypothetical protein